MKKKFKFSILIILGIILLFISSKIISKNKKSSEVQNEIEENKIVDEYTPLEEITEEQARQTVISLYYKSKSTGELIPEERRIDSKNLLENPYVFLLELLISKPDSEELESCIPEGTIVNDVNLNGTTLEINFSKEFIENHLGTLEEEEKTINSIVNTLTELNEVQYIKILIDGKENCEFKDKELDFKEPFSKEQA